jgi:hypothetical protein
MAASSHAEIEDIGVRSLIIIICKTLPTHYSIQGKPNNKYKHLTSSNWLGYLQLLHISFVGLSQG